jgi:lipoyl(octanoyl) transferase
LNAAVRFDGATHSREWFCIDTGEHPGDFNMKFDLGLIEEFRITNIPVLRFYAWNPYCISLGRNQNESDINLELAGRDGIQVVKRPTGGKAVLHAEELTYSVVMETAGMTVRESYNLISTALVEGLRTLGAQLDLSQSSADFQKLFRDPSAIACFSTSAVFEVEHNGRKLVGSAQHRFGDVLLQHGSILTGDFHKRILSYLNVDEMSKKKTGLDLDAHTVTLSEILGRRAERPEIVEAVRFGFEKVFAADFSTSAGRSPHQSISSADRRQTLKAGS